MFVVHWKVCWITPVPQALTVLTLQTTIPSRQGEAPILELHGRAHHAHQPQTWQIKLYSFSNQPITHTKDGQASPF